MRENARGLRAGGLIVVLGGLRAERRATVPTTTSKALSPAEFRDRLQKLLRLASEYAVAESRVKTLGRELDEAPTDGLMDGLTSYRNAVLAEVKSALYDVTENDDGGFDALQMCQSVQDALDVLNLAIERGDDAH